MKASAVLNDKDVWAIAAAQQQHFFSFQLVLPNGRAEEKKFVEGSAARPVSRMNEIHEAWRGAAASPTTNQQSNQINFHICWFDGVDWWSCGICWFVWLCCFWLRAGYGRWHRQWLRPEEKTNKQSQMKQTNGAESIDLWMEWLRMAWAALLSILELNEGSGPAARTKWRGEER